MQGKVDPGNQHEKDGDRDNHGGVEVAHAGVVSRKTADGDGGETVADRVKQVHPC